MTKQVTLENTLPGGFGLPTGQVVPGNGSIVLEPEVWDAAKDHPVVKARIDASTLIVDGEGKKLSGADGRDENGDTPEMAQLRTVFNASYERQGNALAAAQAEVATLTGKVIELEAEITTLKANNGGQGGSDNSGATGAYIVTDKGRGWWAVTQDGKEVTKSLREDDVKDFDKLDPDKQKAFVEANKAD